MKPIEISDIPNVGSSIKDIEQRFEGKYISKEYIDYCDSLEYKIQVYSSLLQNNFNAEINFHVSSFFNDKAKDTCMRRRVIIPIQAASEFVILFTSLYSMQEKNTWIDIQNGLMN